MDDRRFCLFLLVVREKRARIEILETEFRIA